MGFTTFLGSSTDRLQPSRPKPSSSTTSLENTLDAAPSQIPDTGSHHGYIYNETQLAVLPPDCPDLRELNKSLEALAAVFPDIQIQVFREMLTNFDEESRLAVVADALLKNRVSWVKGRWRVADNQSLETGAMSEEPQEQAEYLIPRVETFRSAGYKHAVQTLAWHEFKGLSRSTINAVLAESNYSYLEARKTLVSLSSKSWRFTISSLFLRRKPVATGEAENHPLIVWKSTGQGAIVPSVKSTGDAELDSELYCDLIQPLKERLKQAQEDKDRGLAFLLNNEEADEAGAMHECACCFTESTFEEITTCTADGHILCFRCVQHSIKEAVFGQGWHSSIDTDSGTLKCLAVEGNGCPGHIPYDHMHRAMLEERKGAEILRKLDQRLAENSLLASSLPLTRCSFCGYAEVDDIYFPSHETQLRMCYVCRKDIGGANGDGEGYRHFCDHFRPDGDPRPCTECTKCNLWESEDTDSVLRQAKEEAETKWRETEKRELNGAEKAFLETGFARNGVSPVETCLKNGRPPTLPEFCDFIVETIFV
ncbi:hypothetical protein EsH8_IX_000670 [Colletotrichum jinshuiense]